MAGRKDHARINATADGDNEVVAAVSGKRIIVIGYVITVTGAGAPQLKSGASTVKASFSLAANGGVAYAGSEGAPAFECAVGEAFVVNTPAGVDTLGHVTYETR